MEDDTASSCCAIFRFSRMTSLCTHVHDEHGAVDSVIEQAVFDNITQVTDSFSNLKDFCHTLKR